MLSLSVEYAYGEQYYADERGVSIKCECDTHCSWSDQKAQISLPYEFSYERQTTEWTESSVLSSLDIPCDEKSEIVEYIQSVACVKKIGAALLPAVETKSVEDALSEDVFAIHGSDSVGGTVDDIWREELGAV